mmetsp:Transcript_99582/g.257332  ORF Transcript_99582/g.257332 Transcript_99582/m.257332 type:complete len:262 (+) Transcript_99582:738-1523(+)
MRRFMGYWRRMCSAVSFMASAVLGSAPRRSARATASGRSDAAAPGVCASIRRRSSRLSPCVPRVSSRRQTLSNSAPNASARSRPALPRSARSSEAASDAEASPEPQSARLQRVLPAAVTTSLGVPPPFSRRLATATTPWMSLGRANEVAPSMSRFRACCSTLPAFVTLRALAPLERSSSATSVWQRWQAKCRAVAPRSFSSPMARFTSTALSPSSSVRHARPPEAAAACSAVPPALFRSFGSALSFSNMVSNDCWSDVAAK